MMGTMPGKPGYLWPVKMLTTMAPSVLCVEEMQNQPDDCLIFISMRRIESAAKLCECEIQFTDHRVRRDPIPQAFVVRFIQATFNGRKWFR